MIRCVVILLPVFFFVSCSGNKEPGGPSVSEKIIPMASPSGDSCAEPYLVPGYSGGLLLSWIEKKGGTAALKFSSLEDGSWNKARPVAAGVNWFVNWADYPVLSSNGDSLLMAHYLEKSDTGKFTYDIRYVLSNDGGQNWGEPRLLNEDGKKAEHGFVSVLPYGKGFFACWLDGRNTGTGGTDTAGHSGHHGSMSLRAAMLDPGGNKIAEWELDERVCDCCQTTAVMAPEGPVVMYRDRSEKEVRDISVVRMINGEWTKPATLFPDNWLINACPVNGPRADAKGKHMAVAWYTMKEKKGEVKMVFSDDGGASFSEPVRVDEGRTIGRVDVLLLDSATAMVSWMDEGWIYATKIHAGGKKEPALCIGQSTSKRSGGFPQMSGSEGKIYFAWTDDQVKTIRVVSLPQ